MQLALNAVPNPGETTRALLPPWHTVRIVLEKREFEEKRERYRQEHEKKFRYVMNELKYVEVVVMVTSGSHQSGANIEQWKQ